MKRTIADLLVLGALSLVLGFGVNAVRSSKRIDPTKNYFQKEATHPASATSDRGSEANVNQAVDPALQAAAGAQPTAAGSAQEKPHLKLVHPYQEIDFAELSSVFNSPETRQGLNIFVDARKEDLFAEGHIPGAMHCDPYQVQEHIDEVLDRANGVERVIVYCSGGDCEDSIFMCRELVSAGILEEAVYLYPGGFKEWTANNMPVESGGHP